MDINSVSIKMSWLKNAAIQGAKIRVGNYLF
jgi:hypothetical protein